MNTILIVSYLAKQEAKRRTQSYKEDHSDTLKIRWQ